MNRPGHISSMQTSTTEADVRQYDTAELFRGSHQIEIGHEGVKYRLQITRAGKLILTK